MKKIIAFLCSVFTCCILIYGIKLYYKAKINDMYFDKAGDMVSEDKFKSLALQGAGISRGENLFMFGSSEFEASSGYSTHASSFFNHKDDGFQVNLIGKAGYKTLVHAVDFGALGQQLKGQKVVFVLSPQWFTKGGIDENTFEANSSELQVFGAFLNPSLSRNIKMKLADRILDISKTKPNKDFQFMRDYCVLYSRNDLYHKGLTYIMTPYYWIRYELLSIKDEMKSSDILRKNRKLPLEEAKNKTSFNWSNELKKAEDLAKNNSANQFGMDNGSYKNLTKDGLEKLKDSAKKNSYKISPEYGDFKLLLDICKEEGIKPLILNIPVNGPWYDYTGFSKEDRQAYYKKINQIVASYGFEEADFSKYEYEKYFLKDASHLGWKGWVYVDEAIDRYYHENKK